MVVTTPLDSRSNRTLASTRRSSPLDSETQAKQFTFVFTDIAESTRLLDEIGPARYYRLSEEHRRIVRSAIKEFGGLEVDTAGDAFFIAFENTDAALAATIAIQLALASYRDLDFTGLPVRIGVHRGEAIRTGEGFVGLNVNRAARISAVGHGGQVVVSEETVREVEHSIESSALRPPYAFKDLGRHRLKDLSEPQRLFQLIIEGIENEFPPLRSLEAFPTNLPVALTPFIGREIDVERVCELLIGETTRLITLLGPPGVGKTRLGLQVAGHSIEQYPDGVYFVALGPLSTSDFVLPAVAQVLGVTESSGSLIDAVNARIRDRHVLLFLDNYEHVIDSASAIGFLLDHCKNLRVLVTSRVRLGLDAEDEYVVSPFVIPDREHLPPLPQLAGYDVISLFIERARAVKPSFALTPDNATDVVAICERVDGIALAVELAAARLKLFSVAALLSRLDEQLTLLKRSHRDVSSRQATLENTIRWSYDLLDGNHKRLLDRLSVFRGGFDLKAAREICGQVDELDFDAAISSLTESNLLQKRTQGDTDPRFFLLRLINEFASARLLEGQELEPIHNLHSQYFLTFAEASADSWFQSGSNMFIAKIQENDANIQAALDWSLSQGYLETALRLIGTCCIIWGIYAPLSQVRPKIEQALALDQTTLEPDTVAAGLLAATMIYFRLGDYAKTKHYAQQVLALSDQAVAARKKAIAWYLTAVGSSETGDWDSAQLELTHASAWADKCSSTVLSNWSKLNLARVQLMRKEYDAARGHLNELFDQFMATNDSYSLVGVLANLGYLEIAEGNLPSARDNSLRALDLAQQNNLLHYTPESLVGISTVLAQMGDNVFAAEVLATTQTLVDEQGLTVYAIGQGMMDQTLAELRGQLSQGDFESAWERGQKRSLDDTINLIRKRFQELPKST